MRKTMRTLSVTGLLFAAAPLLGETAPRYQPVVLEGQTMAADTFEVQPVPLPPDGVRAPLPARERAVQHEPMPRSKALPPGAPLFPSPPASEAPGLAPALSPSPSSSFQALLDNATQIPPDTQGAASSTRLLVASNPLVRLQGRDGSVLDTFSLDSFFSNVAGGSGVYDPVVVWDPYASRWIFVACDDAAKTTSKILVSASASSDPAGTFRVLSIGADSTGVLWADYPRVGFNKDWIVVAVNMYTISQNKWNSSNIYAINKAQLYAGGTVSRTQWTGNTDIAGGAPTRTFDQTAGTVYLVEEWNSGLGTIALHSISGSVGGEVLTKKIAFPSGPAWAASSSGDIGPQSGTTGKIDLGDDRMLSATYRNGSVWAAHTVLLPAGNSPTRAAAQWWQLTPSGSVVQRGRVEDTSGVVSYAYPSLAVNKDNAMLLGFSSFAANLFAGASYALRTSSDGTGTMQSVTLLKPGEAPYVKTFSGTKNRWGDYSATVVDPVNDTDFWTIQEYASAPVNGTDRWALWWGRVSPSSGPVSVCTPDSQTLCLSSGRFKVQATYRDYGSNTGSGTGVKLTDLAGYFWFFDSSNPEVLAKFVSFCSGSSGQWGIYISGLTDIQVTFKVTDTKTGLYKEYTNALGHGFCTVGDGSYSCP